MTKRIICEHCKTELLVDEPRMGMGFGGVNLETVSCPKCDVIMGKVPLGTKIEIADTASS